MIQVENLSKTYGDHIALNGITFSVNRGQVLGFLGPNGAGKTTTMRILTGYMPPSSGKATIDGLDVVDDSLQVRQRIGYMPETIPLYDEMTVTGYLRFMAAIRGVTDLEPAIDRVLESCGLGDRRHDIISHLSKGYRQRVGLAQALVHNPDVLVLDEPTAGLDPLQIMAVRELIRELGKEHTIILSTHILPEVSQVCDHVLIINKGKIVAEDTPDKLTSRLDRGARVRCEFANPPEDAAEKLSAIDGVAAVNANGQVYEVSMAVDKDVRASIAECAISNGWGLLRIEPISMSLEDIFVQLTTSEDSPEVEA